MPLIAFWIIFDFFHRPGGSPANYLKGNEMEEVFKNAFLAFRFGGNYNADALQNALKEKKFTVYLSVLNPEFRAEMAIIALCQSAGLTVNYFTEEIITISY